MIENDALSASQWTALKSAVLSLSPVDFSQPAYRIHGTQKSENSALFEGWFADDDITSFAWETRLAAITGETVTGTMVIVSLSDSDSTLIKLSSADVLCRVYLFDGEWAISNRQAGAAMQVQIMPGSGADHYVADLADIPPLSPGDTIYLQRGIAYAGTIIIEQPGVSIRAYGEGDDSVFDLSLSYANEWTNEGDGVWSHPHAPAGGDSSYDGVWSGNYGYALSVDLQHTQTNEGAFWIDTDSDTLYIHLRDGDELAGLKIRNHDVAVKIRAPGCSVAGIEVAYGLAAVTATAASDQPTISNCHIHHCSYFGVDSYAPDTTITQSIIEYCGMNRGGGGSTINGEEAVRGRIVGNTYRYNGGHPMFFIDGKDTRNWGCGPQFAGGAYYGYVADNVIIAADTGIALDIGINSEAAGYHTYINNYCDGGHSECISLNNAPGTIIENNVLWDYAAPQHITRVGSGIKILNGSTGVTIRDNTVGTERVMGASAGLSPVFTSVDLRECDKNLYWQPRLPDRIANNKGAWRTFAQWRADGYDLGSLPPSDPETIKNH